MNSRFLGSKYLSLVLLGVSFSACSSASADQSALLPAPQLVQPVSAAAADPAEKGVVILSKIEIQSGSPSEAVRNFYKLMREKRFVDAMMMTNMRPAVEALTLEDAKELAPDFEPLAAQVPADLVITGEQISGNKASVFLKLPTEGNGNP